MEIYVNYLAIEVTRRCNMKCEHCLRGDAQNLDISTAVLSGIAKHIHPASVIFTGGEPSLNVPAIKRYFELAERYDTMPAAFYVATNGATSKERRDAYNRFRQGLDILDLDALAYRIIGQNRNSIGHWFPELVRAYRDSGFFRIPATTIAKVPLTLLQLTRLDYHSLTPSTIQIVDNWAHAVFRLNDEQDYFVKTGTYSSKFDFRNCLVHGEKEVRELGEYLLYIHHQALQMAGPLSFPCIYGVSTTNEWVVREFIPDKEGNPCIYHGLPLHTEYRVFVDCDSDAVIGVSPYWEPKTMLNRFGSCSDANSPHQMHDYVIFKSHEATLMRRYHENVDSVVEHIREFLPALDLQGQWSIDVMQNGDDFWIIDMAVAENSAFYDCVPESLRRPSAENWIPDILKPNN